MPLYNPVTPKMVEVDVVDFILVLDSGRVRFFPALELTLDGDLEIPIDGAMEVL